MQPRHALLAIHFCALLFGLTGVLGKLAQTTPLAITFGRALFAVIALALFASLFSADRGARPGPRRILLLAGGGLLLGAHWLTFFQAVKISGVAIATLGFAGFPAFTLLLEGLLFRERLHWPEYLAVGLVCLGLALVTPRFDWASEATRGLAWAVFSGLLFALLSLVNRVATRGLDPVCAALWQNLAIAACLLPFAAPLLPAVNGRDWLWIVLLGVFCTGLSHSLFVASLRHLKARTTSVILALEPIYGIAVAWLLFSEQPTPRMLVGGALLVVATLVASRFAKASAKASLS